MAGVAPQPIESLVSEVTGWVGIDLNAPDDVPDPSTTTHPDDNEGVSPDDQGPPENAGPPETAGPPDGSKAPDHAGPPENAGPKDDDFVPGPPDNAGPNDNAGPPEDSNAPTTRGLLITQDRRNRTVRDRASAKARAATEGPPLNREQSTGNVETVIAVTVPHSWGKQMKRSWEGPLQGSARDRGAVLVEFAVLMPLMLLLVLGVIEFGYGLAQHLDVRHGAREASRLVAVDFDDSQDITDEVCSRMDLSSGHTITYAGAGGDIGDQADITVSAPFTDITGFFSGWLPATLNSSVAIRIEQDADSWSNGSFICSGP